MDTFPVPPRTDAPDETDRTRIWLPLLGRLTDDVPDWVVLKHPDSAFTGAGDIDSAAPRSRWPTITRTFEAWAEAQGLGAVIECPHAPTWLHLVALDPTGGRFYELDVNERKLFLGSTFYRAADLITLATVDPRGFRRLRPGAEGLIKLAHNGTRRGGRRNAEGLQAKGVAALLASDRDGIRIASRLFGWAGFAARRGATAVIEGRWDRAAMALIEGRAVIRAPVEPDGLVKRIQSRAARRGCPVLRAVFVGQRSTPTDVDAWLREVERSHRVIRPEARQAGGASSMR